MVRKGTYVSLIVVAFVIGFCSLAAAAVDNVAVIVAKPTILPDPGLANDWYDTQAVYNLYSPLIQPTPEGTIRPHIAERWEPVGGKLDHWRFTIRPGVKFHDDSELTAEDVVFSMQRLQTMGAGYGGIFGKIDPVTVSRYVADFILEKPNASLPETLTLFWPLNKDLVLEHIQPGQYGDFGDYGADWLMTHDAGSGPYVMVEHNPGDRMEAVRFEDYFLGWENWGPDEVPIERVLFLMEGEPATLLLLLRTGQMDLEADGSFSRRTFRDIGETEGIHTLPAHSTTLTAWMNTKKPPTDDVHFRRAIQYAFDYKAIEAEYAFLGAQEGGVYLSTLPAYITIPPVPRVQNLDKAREELALSRYDPEEVTVTFHYCQGLENEEEIVLQLQADMAKLGVKVEATGPPWPQFAAECDTPETSANLSLFKFPAAYPSPDFSLFYMYHPDNVGGIYATHWFANEEIGRLIDQARSTADYEARLAVYRELQEVIGSHALALYAHEIPMHFSAQDYLIGPRETFTMVGPNANMYNWRINLKLKEELRG